MLKEVPMGDNNLAVVQKLYDAYRTKDLPLIFSLLAPSIQIYQSDLLPWGGLYRGYDGAQRFFAALTRHIDSRVDVERFVEAGDQIVVIGWSRGRVNATGKPFEVAVVHVCTVAANRVTRFEAYIDTPAMIVALAAPAGVET
jgi:uncharacterized protein